MHSAPAVSYPVRRSRFHALLLACVVAVGAATLVTWVMQADQWQGRHFVAWLAWLLSALMAAVGWWRAPQGVLQFVDGRWNWLGQGQSVAVTVAVQIDLQHTLLVLTQDMLSKTRWLWLERRCQPLRWADLRRAVFAPPRKAVADGAPEALA